MYQMVFVVVVVLFLFRMGNIKARCTQVGINGKGENKY